MPDTILSLRDLRYRWPASDHDVIAIDQLELDAGERLFLQGPSGSGKSTLLALLGGVLTANSGTLSLMGKDLKIAGAARRDHWRADHVGFIFQQFNLLPYLGLVDNVSLPARFSKLRRQRAIERRGSVEAEARHLLAALDLDGLTQRPVRELSIGQQQRVAVARALFGAPELLIADEPTSALDADNRARFMDLLFTEQAATGAALLFVSHDAGLGEGFERRLSMAELNVAEVSA